MPQHDFYVYNTLENFALSKFIDYREHRSLYAQMAKRSRYFIANWPKFERGEKAPYARQEISLRYMEGAAAGTVMIGQPSTGKVFEENFNWPDAIIEIPLDSTKICDIITDLDAQPERLARIRRENVVNCLLRHDWVYRWEKILETVGLDPLPDLETRKMSLNNIAAKI